MSLTPKEQNGLNRYNECVRNSVYEHAGIYFDKIKDKKALYVVLDYIWKDTILSSHSDTLKQMNLAIEQQYKKEQYQREFAELIK